MKKNFWFAFIFFFVYIFPLFFSFVGIMKWNAWAATGSLIVGIVGWTIFVRFLYKRLFILPNKSWKQALWLQRNGKLVEAEITEVLSRKETSRGSFLTEIKVSFPNLVGTTISTSMEFEDIKPELNRFTKGKKFPLRLNTQKPVEQLPWINGYGEIIQNKLPTRWLFAFSLIYAVVTFIIHYAIFSDGQGWRFVTIFHPWVFTPFLGRLIMGSMGIFMNNMRSFTSSDSSMFELLLHGVKIEGKITKMSQTGIYVNNLPQIMYTISFTDRKGQTHFIDQSKVVLFNEINNYQPGDVQVLYLPSNPTLVELV
ncbi:MAG: hypothetical protein BWZ00_01301 [Bacteroidetes bacterium ADurb.BinA174]|nr:MAG: hypothetical protein BWZ00_01301 [Bacteroidetes bacterium ADurb.BinA174]